MIKNIKLLLLFLFISSYLPSYSFAMNDDDGKNIFPRIRALKNANEKINKYKLKIEEAEYLKEQLEKISTPRENILKILDVLRMEQSRTKAYTNAEIFKILSLKETNGSVAFNELSSIYMPPNNNEDLERYVNNFKNWLKDRDTSTDEYAHLRELEQRLKEEDLIRELKNPLMTNPCVTMHMDDKPKKYVLINQTKDEFYKDDLNFDICPSPYPQDAIFVFKDDPSYDSHKAAADVQEKK